MFVEAVSTRDLAKLAKPTGRVLEKRGLLERDVETAWLAAATEAGPLYDPPCLAERCEVRRNYSGECC